jgi:hypothetical protein
LRESDRIETGEKGHVTMRLGEDSRIKIGAEAEFNVLLIDDGKDADGVF